MVSGVDKTIKGKWITIAWQCDSSKTKNERILIFVYKKVQVQTSNSSATRIQHKVSSI